MRNTILLATLCVAVASGPAASMAPPRAIAQSTCMPLLFRLRRRKDDTPDAAATAARVQELETAVEELTARVVTLEARGGFLPGAKDATAIHGGSKNSAPALYNRTADEVWTEYEEATNQRERAERLCAWLRIKTEGNTVRHDGTGDSDEFRALWQRYSGEAVSLFRELLKESPDDPALISDFVECFSYQSSGKGIAKAALTGDAAVFVRRGGPVDKLRRQHAEYGDGIAYIFSIAFYLAAPWPVRNPGKAQVLASEMLKISECRRNLYYAGLAAQADGDVKAARCLYERALNAPATTQSEMDITGALKREVRRALGSLP